MENPEKVIMRRFGDLVLMFRFYAVLRRFGYIDPLIYSLDPDQIRDVITQAIREYHSYVSSAKEESVNLRICNKSEVSIPCLDIAEADKTVPKEYKEIFKDIVHPVKNDKKYCLAPIKCVDGVEVALPTDDMVSEFMSRVSNDLRYARALAELALSAGVRDKRRGEINE